MADILVNVLLDRSDSMAPRITDVIGHFNTYVEELRQLPFSVDVSLSVFDDVYDNLYLNRRANEVPLLDTNRYNARGSTALLDAVGRLITSVDAIQEKPEKIIFVINTDGEENASKEYSKTRIKEMITERQNNHGWQFVFIGAGIDAFSDKHAAGIGINTNSTWSSSNTARGYDDMYTVLAASTQNFASGEYATMDMLSNAKNLNITPEGEVEEEEDENTRQRGSKST